MEIYEPNIFENTYQFLERTMVALQFGKVNEPLLLEIESQDLLAPIRSTQLHHQALSQQA